MTVEQFEILIATIEWLTAGVFTVAYMVLLRTIASVMRG